MLDKELDYIESVSEVRNIVTHSRINHSKEILLFPFKSDLEKFLKKIRKEVDKLGFNSDHILEDYGSCFEIFAEYESLFYIGQYRKCFELLGKAKHLIIFSI